MMKGNIENNMVDWAAGTKEKEREAERSDKSKY